MGGAIIAEIANGSYQWFDLNQPGNESKGWDYWGSASAGITGVLAPGKNVWKNAGISAGWTIFIDDLDKSALTGTEAGWVFGATMGALSPHVLEPILGPDSGFVSEVNGSVGGEFIGNKTKAKINEKEYDNANK
ncbi:hypothetical protein [Erwinia sp. QL-Z3]|uniref:hypothetical protein n=1 Tax=Erwinia sp. QL-Z3 TaxID=2547962 RepID=UPI001FD7E0ED|nr:hypothetical protein [Erwinia sp. QL-Z3]